jgi:hypothetical protein
MKSILSQVDFTNTCVFMQRNILSVMRFMRMYERSRKLLDLWGELLRTIVFKFPNHAIIKKVIDSVK